MRKLCVAAAMLAALGSAGCLAVPVPHWKERDLGSSLYARDRHLYVVGFVSVWPEINTEYIVVLNHDPKIQTKLEYDPPHELGDQTITYDAGPIYYRRVGGSKVDAALSPTSRRALVYDRAGARLVVFDLESRKVMPLGAVPERARIWGPTWSEDESRVVYTVRTVKRNSNPAPLEIADTAYEAALEDGEWKVRATAVEVRDVHPPDGPPEGVVTAERKGEDR
jgi:hypothetical protein